MPGYTTRSAPGAADADGVGAALAEYDGVGAALADGPADALDEKLDVALFAFANASANKRPTTRTLMSFDVAHS